MHFSDLDRKRILRSAALNLISCIPCCFLLGEFVISSSLSIAVKTLAEFFIIVSISSGAYVSFTFLKKGRSG